MDKPCHHVTVTGVAALDASTESEPHAYTAVVINNFIKVVFSLSIRVDSIVEDMFALENRLDFHIRAN